MDDVNRPRYPLKIERLRSDITMTDVRQFFCWPPADILENVEIFSNGPMTTAFVVLNRPDIAYKFLNLKEPEIDGGRVTLKPELFEEMSVTLNRSWLREIEDENPTIQIDIQKIADKFALKLKPQTYAEGDAGTISLAGIPWRIEQAKAYLNDKIETIIMDRSANVQNKFHAGAAGIRSYQSTNVEDGLPAYEQIKPVLKLEDSELSVDPYPNPNAGVQTKGLTELDNTNPSKKRIRALKTGETKSEASGVIATISNNDVITDQPKEVKRNRILVSKPEDMQKSDSSVDSLGKSTTIDYPVSTLYKKVIRVEMDIHMYLVEHSTLLGFTDGSVNQFQVSEQHIDWVIGGNNENDLRHNEECLRRIIDELHTKCYSAPDEFDFEIFKDTIETNNKNKEVTLIFNSKERSCKIVGNRDDDVKRTYKWISSMSGELRKRCKQKPGKVSEVNSDSKNYAGGSSAQQLDQQQSGPQRYPQDCKSHSSDTGNQQGPFTNLRGKEKKPGDGIHISKGSSKDRLEFTTRGNLRVSVYQGNMIKQSTEVIVNPANEYLAHAGGLARVILDAGGPVIDGESRDIISKQGKVQTSEVVHTSAGNLPPPIKYVIHAVGPTAHEFKDNKAGLVPTLKITFRNCLEYANDQLFVSSISLPPISSGIFAVPMPDIIQGAVEAIQDFDQKNPSAVLKEVHFISNDAKATGEMIACFRKVIG